MPHGVDFIFTKKIILLAQKCYSEIGIAIAINLLLKLGVSSIQHLKLNREYFLACIFFFIYIKLQERLIKIQLPPINKSYLKFRHLVVLSKL